MKGKMMSDLTDRLRCKPSRNAGCLMDEAADRIDALEWERDELKEMNVEMFNAISSLVFRLETATAKGADDV